MHLRFRPYRNLFDRCSVCWDNYRKHLLYDRRRHRFDRDWRQMDSYRLRLRFHRYRHLRRKHHLRKRKEMITPIGSEHSI